VLDRLTDPSWDHHTLGWEDFFEQQLTPKERRRFQPARIIEAYRKRFLVHTGSEVLWSLGRGSMFHHAKDPTELPAVGDWALIERTPQAEHARLWRLLDRRSALIRQAAGERTQAQVISANLDHIFVVSSMNQEFNPRRIERYMTLAKNSGAQITVILNKSDVTDSSDAFVQAAQEAAPFNEILALSMVTEDGHARLAELLEPGKTFGFIGSSGVGKSTIVNHLYGESVQATSEVREVDDHGRHTTTARQLIVLSSGALLVDTPGMRELGLWKVDEESVQAFSDVLALAETCKFRDCRHEGSEAGCAVHQAVERGEISAERVLSWRKLTGELALQRDRQTEAERIAYRRQNARRSK
jgi:ribosome biogenesis GTPase